MYSMYSTTRNLALCWRFHRAVRAVDAARVSTADSTLMVFKITFTWMLSQQTSLLGTWLLFAFVDHYFILDDDSTGHLPQYRPVQDTLHNTGQYRTPYTIQASTRHRTQYRRVQETFHNTGQYRTPSTIQAITGHLPQYRPLQDTFHNPGHYRTLLPQYRPVKATIVTGKRV